MIRYILTKILNKYKLYLCLMIGNISIIMIFAVMMMFRDGSRMKLIQRGFTKQYEETGSFPASIFRESNINPDAMGDSSDKTISDDLNAYENSWKKYIDAPVLASQRFVYYKAIDAKYSYRKAKSIAIGYLEDGKKESGSSVSEHYNIVSGADYHEDISKYLPEGVTIPEDAVPCLVSEYTADAYDIVPGDSLEITIAPKGFGSENMSKVYMLKPADGVDGVKQAVISAVKEAGPNSCPPVVVGVGIGGDFELAAKMAKKALTRKADSHSPLPHIAKLEEELLEEINKTGIGPGGLGGKTTALALNIETYATHIAGLPVAVNMCCHVNRHMTKIL